LISFQLMIRDLHSGSIRHSGYRVPLVTAAPLCVQTLCNSCSYVAPCI